MKADVRSATTADLRNADNFIRSQMASFREMKELLALYCLYEGLEDTIIYTFYPEEEIDLITAPTVKTEDLHRTSKKTKGDSLKKKVQREK